MLWMYQRVFFGTLSDEVKHHMPDFNFREWVCIAPLIVMMVWMGILTQTFLPKVSETNAQILNRAGLTAAAQRATPLRAGNGPQSMPTGGGAMTTGGAHAR
jgi:NADH-quinone oxidoreductase subunit M